MWKHSKLFITLHKVLVMIILLSHPGWCLTLTDHKYCLNWVHWVVWFQRLTCIWLNPSFNYSLISLWLYRHHLLWMHKWVQTKHHTIHFSLPHIRPLFCSWNSHPNQWAFYVKTDGRIWVRLQEFQACSTDKESYVQVKTPQKHHSPVQPKHHRFV